jgi:hypothetical protein
MSLNKYHVEEIRKYSFIDGADIRGGKIRIFYEVKGKPQIKEVLMRLSVNHLQKAITEIRTEMGVSNYGKGQHSDIYTSAD